MTAGGNLHLEDSALPCGTTNCGHQIPAGKETLLGGAIPPLIPP